MSARRTVALALLVASGIGACDDRDVRLAEGLTGGDVARGRRALDRFGCGACHVIPGVAGARGLVGPSLAQLALRSYVAGKLSNQPDLLVKWIRFPQQIDPGTAMPDLNVDAASARDMAAYLYTLR